MQNKFAGHRLRDALSRAVEGRQAIAYDGDMTAEERRAVERAFLGGGRGRTVIATSALEVGVDLPGLDVVVMDELPPRRADLLQRLGRVGRSAEAPGLAVLCLGYSPADERSLREPARALSLEGARPPTVPSHLDSVRLRMASCALSEWEGRLSRGRIERQDLDAALGRYFGAQISSERLGELVEERLRGLVELDDGAWHYQGFRVSASQGRKRLVLQGTNIAVAQIEDMAIFRDAHPEGVYLGHQGRRYRVVGYRVGARPEASAAPEGAPSSPALGGGPARGGGSPPRGVTGLEEPQPALAPPAQAVQGPGPRRSPDRAQPASTGLLPGLEAPRRGGSSRAPAAPREPREPHLGRFMKALEAIEVVEEKRRVATRGRWRDELSLYEARVLPRGADVPRSGALEYGVFRFLRRFDGYLQIDLTNRAPLRVVPLSEIMTRFREASGVKNGLPFLRDFAYLTLGWRWRVAGLLTDAAARQRLAPALSGLLLSYLCDEVECARGDLVVSLAPEEGELRVIDGTPAGNGLSEALLADGRVFSALTGAVQAARGFLSQPRRAFEIFLAEECRLESELTAEELTDALQKLARGWGVPRARG